MAVDNITLYQNIVSLLNRANSKSALKSAMNVTVFELLGFLGFTYGAIRINTGSGKVDLSTETKSGGLKLCFDKLDAPDCVCKKALEETNSEVIISGKSIGLCCEDNFSTLVCAPIRANGQNVGLFLAASEKQIETPEDRIDLVNMICQNIGDTVQRTAAVESDHQRALDMKTVNAIGRLITSKLNLKDMVREIVSTLGGVLETDEVNVIMYDVVRRELSFLASYFADGSKLDRPEVHPLSDGINSWIIKNRRPLLMTYNTEEECAKLGIRHGGRPAKSWLGAPMIYHDRVVGVISVQSYAKTELYDENSAYLIAAVANQCAVAVENARLFEEIIDREEEKGRLYFSLTHDLLSLINPVAGFTKILKTIPPGAEDDKARLIDNITSATEKITRFAEDILVYSKIKSGKLALDISRQNVLGPIDSAIRVYLPELNMRSIELSVNGHDIGANGLKHPGSKLKSRSLEQLLSIEPIMADLDGAQMERVFLNCIGNSVKHARSKIEIVAKSSDSQITCHVRDDGDGVPSSQCDNLFKEYYQAGSKQKGVGLGLPSVKKIIELHDGEIKIRSDKGAGFTIEFSWPRTLADRQEQEPDKRTAL
jgi:signal transduction histidine kinase